MNKVIVIDGTNIQFISIFNYMSQKSTIPCTWTFLSMLCGYLRRLEVTLDDLVILALDYGSWRKSEDKKYTWEENRPQLTKLASTWVINYLLPLLEQKQQTISEMKLDAENMAELIFEIMYPRKYKSGYQDILWL